MRAAAVQYFATPFQLERNLETAGRLIRQAAAQGAQVAALPEWFNTGYVYSRRLFAAAEDSQGPTLSWLAALSAELGLLLAGCLLLREGGHLFDALILDPPRAGLSERSLARVREVAAGKVFYVSCNPSTLARDVRFLSDRYDLSSLEMHDFFPNTHHVEALAVLTIRG